MTGISDIIGGKCKKIKKLLAFLRKLLYNISCVTEKTIEKRKMRD